MREDVRFVSEKYPTSIVYGDFSLNAKPTPYGRRVGVGVLVAAGLPSPPTFVRVRVRVAVFAGFRVI